MQSATMLRTSGLVSANQRCSTRATFKQSVSPAGLRQRTVRVTRAEPENTSVAGGSITNEGETKPDSYELIEAPVRGKDSADKSYAYDGKPISERQNDVDRLLVNQNAPEEKSFLGTKVSFPDALRFKGAAPEVINSRLAMLGIAAALTAEGVTGKNIFQQVQAYPQSIAATFALWIVASLVPILRGVPRKGNAVFTSGGEINLGRLAMMGFVALIATEYFSGGQTISQFYGLHK